MIFAPRTVAHVTLWQVLALVPPIVAAGWSDTLGVSSVFLVAAATALVWEMLFAVIRKRPASVHGITTALIVGLLCAPDTSLWQIAVAVSLGIVFGELIFGGRGFGFVSAATLSLSFLIVAFPDTFLRAPSPEMAVAVLPGLALLFFVGLVSASVLLGVGLGALALLAATAQAIDPVPLVIALSVGAVFLVADPTAASATTLGRWIYGALAGALIMVFSPGGSVASEAVVSAALLASVFAPLIDHGAVFVHVHMRRSQRHG